MSGISAWFGGLDRGRRIRALLVLGVVVLLVVTAISRIPSAGRRTIAVSADFADTTGLYVGNEVQYLGVPVGKVTSIDARGTVMGVHMRIDADVPVPRSAGAEILQSALLTDRFVQLGPAYRGGPALADGAHIAVGRTRSPMNIDDVGKAIDDLVRALDQTGPGGRDIGDLLHATARTFDGNGAQVRRLILASRQALADINAKAPDLRRIVANLGVITDLLTRRDGTIRRLTGNLDLTAQTLAAQSAGLGHTLDSLAALTTSVQTFVMRNKGRLAANLRDVAAVSSTIRSQQQALSRIFDLMPTGAENIARAFDPQRGSLRVNIALRDTLIFNRLVRSQVCNAFVGPLCNLFFNQQGTGALDLLLDYLSSAFPGRF